ncbi:MAG: hypothetical protein ACLUMN_04765 [Oscillospiraceae bacterium]
MTKKIFQSIFLVAGAVLLASLLIIMGFLYSYFGGVEENQLRDELSLPRPPWKAAARTISRAHGRALPPDVDRGRRQRFVRHQDRCREP